MELTIQKAHPSEAGQIAQIHLEEIQTGFLSTLGIKFLTALYKAMIESSVVLVAKKDSKIIGFVSGTKNIKGVYKKIILKNFFILLVKIGPKILRSSKKILETLLYPNKLSENLPVAEILSIAVRSDFQKQGVGKDLFRLCKKELGVEKIKMIVGENLTSSHELMSSLKAKKVKTIKVHGDTKSYIYIT